MKTPIKIAILLFSVVGVIVGVLIFAKSRVSPPQAVELGNPYVAHLDTLTKDINNKAQSGGDPMTAVTQSFWDEYVLLQLMIKEERVKADESDNQLDKALGEYVRVLPDAARASLRSGNTCSGIDQVAQCLKAIKPLQHSDGTAAISDEHKSTLAPLTVLVNDYREAWALSKRTSFNGNLSDAREKIEQANSYKDKEFIKDCSSLMTALDNLPRYLSNGHYYYLARQAEDLYYYRQYGSWSNFKSAYEAFKSAMSEYENATDVYGSEYIRDTQPLWNVANQGYNWAYNDGDFT